MKIEKSGYGAGTRDFPGHPNVVRLTIGEAATSLDCEHLHEETISVLEANLDDLNPQVFGYVMDRLLEEGALDVFGMPVQMKKNRPGTLLTVLCKPEDAEQADADYFCRDDYSRCAPARRTAADAGATVVDRDHALGDVRMKIASMNGTVTNYAPGVRRLPHASLRRTHVPLKMVMQEAMQGYLQGRKNLNHSRTEVH